MFNFKEEEESNEFSAIDVTNFLVLHELIYVV